MSARAAQTRNGMRTAGLGSVPALQRTSSSFGCREHRAPWLVLVLGRTPHTMRPSCVRALSARDEHASSSHPVLPAHPMSNCRMQQSQRGVAVHGS